MTTVIGGSAPSITFSDSTTQSTAALPLTGGSVSADITVHGLTVGLGGGSVSTNTAVGNGALSINTTGAYNTALGYQALQANTTSSYSTAVGNNALINSTGQGNTALGQNAGNTTTSGANNIFVGAGNQASSSLDSSCIVIGTSIAGKGGSTGFISPNGGGVYQGNNSSTWSTTSDQRLKKNIVTNTDGLDKITGIQVRNFEYRLPEEVTELDKSCAVNITGLQLGPIAQELAQVLPDCVKTESTGVMSVDSSNVLWHLVTAVQQLNALITAQATEIQTLKAKVGI